MRWRHSRSLRDRHLRRPLARLTPDLRPPPRQVVTHRRVGDPLHLVLGHQPIEDPLVGMTLLAGRVQVHPQHRIDRRFERIQPGLARRRLLTRLRPRRSQRFSHRTTVHPVLTAQRTDAHTLDPRVPPDRSKHLNLGHPRHLRSLTSRSTSSVPPQPLGWGQNSPERNYSITGWGHRSPEGGARTHP